MSISLEALGLKPLKVKCIDTDCERDLHCFKRKRKVKGQPMAGPCRACGAELVEWERVHQRDTEDRAYTFDALRNELIRHHFWHLPIDEKALAHATRKGRHALHAAARDRLVKSVGRASARLFRDGMQTPMEGNAIYYAQHAVAACCRKCIEYWHDIPRDRDLSAEEIVYLSDLVCRYIDERLPELDDEPRRVPRKRKKADPGFRLVNTLNTDRLSAQMRAAAVDPAAGRLLVTRFEGSKQERDLSEPPNCGGFGRIRALPARHEPWVAQQPTADGPGLSCARPAAN